MRNSLLILVLSIIAIGCSEYNIGQSNTFEIPTRNHDLGYIPFDAEIDNPNYLVCDSNAINSGRNRIQYTSGSDQLRKDLVSNFQQQADFEVFSGYIVIRFLVNCEGKTGRYRVEALNLDFTPSKAPTDLLKKTVYLVKNLDSWSKTLGNDSKEEYLKYINLKIENGKIEHVLL